MTSNSANLNTRPDPVQADVRQKETRQLNMAAPVQMHRQLRVRAAQEGVTVREWCIRVLEVSLETDPGIYI